ncbi:MAG: hypothetical protein V3T23_04310, partial [Nitrososphaerales archaeon]
MGIDHRGSGSLVIEEFLDGPDVVAVLKQPVEKRGDYPSLFRITLERLANFRGSPGIHAADLA